jgi:peroxiredoxin (alkyl hydroperoxide reductase subunit C)
MIMVGSKAPNFSAPAIVGGKVATITLSEVKSRFKVLFFYPLDFTFVCPTELHALADKQSEFLARDTELIAISVDSVFSHLTWLNTPRHKGGIEGFSHPLVADLTKSIARSYGVLNEEAGIAWRGTFILDANQIIQHASVNNLPLGRNVDEILRLVDAITHVDTHGEVCPMNWTPAKPSMKPTSQGLAEYFAQ